jgi:SAM-dependent methyltransferase
MHDGVSTLESFHESPRGRVAASSVRAALAGLWPRLPNQRVLGLGYAVPFLSLWRDHAERTIALMPDDQGARPWPSPSASLVVHGEAALLPFADRSFDRVLLVHALEAMENTRRSMREVWRVLADGGKLILVVPNRRGMWAHLEGTPFGHGRPYSAGQLRRLCAAHMFQPGELRETVFVPPVPWRPFLRTAPLWEAFGRLLWPGLAGILVLEAEKTVLSPLTVIEAAPVRRTVPVGEMVPGAALAARRRNDPRERPRNWSE